MAQRDAGSQPSRVPVDQGEGWRWCWMPWRRLGSLPVPLSPRSKIPSIAPLSAHPPAWPSRIGHIPMRPPSNNSTANISKHQLPANGQDIQQQSFYRARNQSRAAPGVLMTNHPLPVLPMEFAQGFPTEQLIGSNYDRRSASSSSAGFNILSRLRHSRMPASIAAVYLHGHLAIRAGLPFCAPRLHLRRIRGARWTRAVSLIPKR